MQGRGLISIFGAGFRHKIYWGLHHTFEGWLIMGPSICPNIISFSINFLAASGFLKNFPCILTGGSQIRKSIEAQVKTSRVTI